MYPRTYEGLILSGQRGMESGLGAGPVGSDLDDIAAARQRRP